MNSRSILSRMGIPRAYQHCTFEAFKLPAAPDISGLVEQIKAAAEAQKWIILASPTTGIGKTHLACAALARAWWVNRQKGEASYRFHSVRRLGLDLDMAGVGLSEVLDKVLTDEDFGGTLHSVLFDELGREPERARQKMECIIDECHQKNVQLIATSNLSSADFRELYDPPIIRRIDDNGLIIDCNWTYKQGATK